MHIYRQECILRNSQLTEEHSEQVVEGSSESFEGVELRAVSDGHYVAVEQEKDHEGDGVPGQRGARHSQRHLQQHS